MYESWTHVTVSGASYIIVVPRTVSIDCRVTDLVARSSSVSPRTNEPSPSNGAAHATNAARRIFLQPRRQGPRGVTAVLREARLRAIRGGGGAGVADPQERRRRDRPLPGHVRKEHADLQPGLGPERPGTRPIYGCARGAAAAQGAGGSVHDRGGREHDRPGELHRGGSGRKPHPRRPAPMRHALGGLRSNDGLRL